MLDALLILKNLREQLDDWLKELEANPTTKPLPTSIFRFGKSSKNNTKLPLLNWWSNFYQTLLAKFSLYFHDVLAVFGPASDMKVSHAFGSPNFLQTLHTFIKKNTPILVCIIANRIEQDEPFYGNEAFSFPKLENTSLIQGDEYFVLKRKSKNLSFLPQNHLPRGNFMRESIARIPEA